MLLVALFLGAMAGLALQPAGDWETLESGIELKWLTASQRSPVGDSRITVVRIDPKKWELRLVGRSQSGDSAGQTAREFAQRHHFVAAINAGMFAQDYTTHVGYMESRGQVHSGTVNTYQSVAAFDPHEQSAPPFRIFDLDEPGISVQSIRRDYASLVQNLRLIKKPGQNRWSEQDKKWSEAALGEDQGGRILLIFCRSPFSMHDLNRELLSASIGLVALQHLEGGPEAQLFVKAGDTELELVGSHGTSYRDDAGKTSAWPIPNVLGVRRKSAPQ